MMGDEAVLVFIRAWKRSYLGHISDWSSESIIAKIMEYMVRLDPTRTHTPDISDGDRVANIVSAMRHSHPEVHAAFLAYHLHVVDGKRYPKARHYQLAKMLGIAPRTFRSRQARGFEIVRQALDESLDSRAAFFV